MSQAVNYVKFGLNFVYDRRINLHNLNISSRMDKTMNDND